MPAERLVRAASACVVYWSLCICGWRCYGEEVPSYSETRSAYLQNLLLLGNFRVNAELEFTETTDYLENLTEQTQRGESWLTNVPSDRRPLVEAKLEALRKTTRAVDERLRRGKPQNAGAAFAFTPKLIYIIRAKTSDEFRGPFPPQPTKKSDLTSGLMEFSVLCWSPTQRPTTWIWQGIDPRFGRPFGTLSERSPSDLVNIQLPPIGSMVRD